MITVMKQRLLTIAFAALLALAPLAASAAKDEEETNLWEARMEGYPTNVRLEEKGTSLTWLLTIVLVAMTVAAMLKNAKRTHLD
jgi:hypothetical protein